MLLRPFFCTEDWVYLYTKGSAWGHGRVGTKPGPPPFGTPYGPPYGPLMDPLWTPLWTPNLDPHVKYWIPNPKINPTLSFGPYPPPSNLDLQQFASKHKPQTFSRVCLRLKRDVYRWKRNVSLLMWRVIVQWPNSVIFHVLMWFRVRFSVSKLTIL
jgi:hypothetical protein